MVPADHGPEFDGTAGRGVRIASDDRVQPRHSQIEIHRRNWVCDWIGGAVKPGPELDVLERAGKRNAASVGKRAIGGAVDVQEVDRLGRLASGRVRQGRAGQTLHESAVLVRGQLLLAREGRREERRQEEITLAHHRKKAA